MPSVEPALEALLLSLAPGATAGWEGSSPDEVDRLEALAGRALPPFYRWFLSRMGSSMGFMRYPTVDFSTRGVLAAYAQRRIARHPRFLLIGYEHDEETPLHYFYDLERPARGDALVVRMLTPNDETHEQFETLREMLAWGELWSQRVEHAPQRCRGTLRSEGSLHERLEPLLRGLAFGVPIETGVFCGLYERSDAALLCTGTPNEASGSQAFNLGAHDPASAGLILGAIASEPAIEVKISSWEPRLPSAG